MSILLHHPESDCYYVEPDPQNVDWSIVHQVDPSDVPQGAQIQTLGAYPSTSRPSMDFETYSESGYHVDPVTKAVKGLGSQGKGGITAVGAPVYAEHPSTEVLCLYYDLKDGRGIRGYIPGLTPEPVDLLNWVRSGGTVEAFNFTFEWWIWNMVCARRMGWPELALEQGVCVMARSRRFSLPGGMGKVAKVLQIEGKQSDGGALIRKLTRPTKPTKKRPEIRWYPWTAPEDFKRFYSYCGQDVYVEDSAAARIPDLTEYERQVWLTDQRINARGVLVDRKTLDAAITLYRGVEKQLTLELATVTGGAVGSVSEVQKMGEWLAAQSVHLPDLTAETVESALNNERIQGKARRVLEIREALAGANTKKLFTLDLQLNSDNRLRDQYSYCGADRTGRWSAGGVQLQNLTAKGPKARKCLDCDRHFGEGAESLGVTNACPECGSVKTEPVKDWLIDSMLWGIEDIQRLANRPDLMAKTWPDTMKLIAGCLRGLFVAKEGARFICCDFSAIEAVVLACLSGCQWRIDVFATHGKIYEMSAAAIMGKTLEYYLDYKKQQGTHHPDRKKVGKVAELASGYGGWIGAWRAFGAEGDDAEIKKLIIAWRDASPEIVEFWGGQFRQVGPKPWDAVPELFGLEGCAIAAIQRPGTYHSVGPITYAYDKRADILYCRLPSGRFLHYHRPRLAPAEDKLNRGPCVKITFEGWNGNSTKGPVGWLRMETYGGRLAENVTQAVAADIQAEALVRVEAAGYPVVMHTHDEIIAECPYGFGSWQHMAEIMAQRPAWADWWPIRADGWEHERYQKD